jgi:hypothetical protein
MKNYSNVIKATAHALEKCQEILTFFHFSDCWLDVCMRLGDPVIGHLDAGFLGFPVSSSKW